MSTEGNSIRPGKRTQNWVRKPGSRHSVFLDGDRVWQGTASGDKEALDNLHEALIEDGEYETLEDFAGARGLTIDDFSVKKD